MNLTSAINYITGLDLGFIALLTVGASFGFGLGVIWHAGRERRLEELKWERFYRDIEEGRGLKRRVAEKDKGLNGT